MKEDGKRGLVLVTLEIGVAAPYTSSLWPLRYCLELDLHYRYCLIL